MAEHGAAMSMAAVAAGSDKPEPDDEPRRARSRSPRAQCAWHNVRNVGILRGATGMLMATLNVVNARADNLDRNVRALSLIACGESPPTTTTTSTMPSLKLENAASSWRQCMSHSRPSQRICSERPMHPPSSERPWGRPASTQCRSARRQLGPPPLPEKWPAHACHRTATVGLYCLLQVGSRVQCQCSSRL